MRGRTVKFSKFEYKQITKAQEMLRRYGTDSVECPNCGWKPEFPWSRIDNLALGSVIKTGCEVLIHFLEGCNESNQP